MICSKCGREYQNIKGKCPFCAERRSLSKRQKERASKISGSTFECQQCGEEMTFVHDVPVHVLTGTIECRKSK
jgi:transcription elongation factor Elf1